MKRWMLVVIVGLALVASPVGAQGPDGFGCTTDELAATLTGASSALGQATQALQNGDMATALALLEQVAEDAAAGHEACVPSAQGGDPNAPLGSYDNPIPLGEVVETEDFMERPGGLMINSVERDAGAFIIEQNRFNSEPEPGKEWVVVSVTLRCDQPIGEICEPGYFTTNLKLSGSMGVLYEADWFTSFTEELPQEMLGGGQATGYLAYEVDEAEEGLFLLYNPDRNTRIFFAAE